MEGSNERLGGSQEVWVRTSEKLKKMAQNVAQKLPLTQKYRYVFVQAERLISTEGSPGTSACGLPSNRHTENIASMDIKELIDEEA